MSDFKYSGDFKKDITSEEYLNTRKYDNTAVDHHGRLVYVTRDEKLYSEITDDIKSYYDYSMDEPIPFIIIEGISVKLIIEYMTTLVNYEIIKSGCTLDVDRYLFGEDAAMAYERLYDRYNEQIRIDDSLYKDEYNFINSKGIVIKFTKSGQLYIDTTKVNKLGNYVKFDEISKEKHLDLYISTLTRTDAKHLIKYLNSANIPRDIEVAKMHMQFCLDGKVFNCKSRLGLE